MERPKNLERSDFMKILVVVDMQNDFITGSLGSDLAKGIVQNVVTKVKNFDGEVIFTRDTHFEDYMQTQEGRNLPVVHCVKGTEGWQVYGKTREALEAVEAGADIMNTISYELLCVLTKRIRRVYI